VVLADARRNVSEKAILTCIGGDKWMPRPRILDEIEAQFRHSSNDDLAGYIDSICFTAFPTS